MGNPTTEENVLVFPSTVLDTLPTIRGFTDRVTPYARAVFDHPETCFRRRSDVESDPSWKQVIPYVLVRDRESRFLVYNRDPGGGEGRLHGKWSLGVGGHINDTDGRTPRLAYANGILRELCEEVGCDPRDVDNLRLFGCLHDPSTDVGRVHFGFVYTLDLPGVSFSRCTLQEASFSTKSDIKSTYDRFESWSQIVIDGCFGGNRSA